MTTQRPERSLTFNEMCDVLRISRMTLSRLIASGEIRASRIGEGKRAQYRFSADEPTRYLEQNRVQPISA